MEVRHSTVRMQHFLGFASVLYFEEFFTLPNRQFLIKQQKETLKHYRSHALVTTGRKQKQVPTEMAFQR